MNIRATWALVARFFVVPLVASLPLVCMADGGRLFFDDWTVDKTSHSVEAYTVSGTDTSFGVFCSNGQCVAYIHQPLNCAIGSRSVMLLSTGPRSVAMTTQCAQIGQQQFQILDQFEAILDALRTAQFLVFAIPTQDGVAISKFGVRGSQAAIKYAIEAAANAAANPAPPSFSVTPGVRKAEEISI